MSKIIKKNSYQKIQVLKQNLFFQGVSQNRLQILQLNVKPTKFSFNQVIYSEGDDVDGVYLVVKGSVKYVKNVRYQTPVESNTNNIWFKQQVVKSGINYKSKMKSIAIFESSDMVGFEEIIREYIVKREQLRSNTKMSAKEKNESLGKCGELKRDFTLVSDAMNTEALFFSNEWVISLLKRHPIHFVKEQFHERAKILKTSMEDVEKPLEKLQDQAVPKPADNLKSEKETSDLQPNQPQNVGTVQNDGNQDSGSAQ